MMILMLRSFALMVVQRHNAASKSTSPCRTGQHVSFALLPIPLCTSPPSTSTHPSNFRVSMGQVCGLGGGGGQGVSLGGVGGGFTTGVGGGFTTGGDGGYTTGGLGE